MKPALLLDLDETLMGPLDRDLVEVSTLDSLSDALGRVGRGRR